MEEELSPKELENLLAMQPREGSYCDGCKVYRGSDGCAPFETTRNDSVRLTEEYRNRYFKLTSCPYFEKKI
jgi:hypothetical protein